MHPEIVLVTGPIVGVCSWAPTQEVLQGMGYRVHLPDVVGTATTSPPRWSEWNDHILRLLELEGSPVLVGHSAAGILVADLALRVPAKGLLIVDGTMPPATGRATWKKDVVEFIREQADEQGRLPKWTDWRFDDKRKITLGIAALERDPRALAIFNAGLPQFRLEWFFDAFELAPWNHVPAGYLLTSSRLAPDADEAERRGWPVSRIDGTHLHPMLEPVQTASEIDKLLKRLPV